MIHLGMHYLMKHPLLVQDEGCIENKDISELDFYANRLEDIGKKLPSVVEFRYRHDIKQDDHFKMEQGFSNFQYIALIGNFL